MTTIDLDPTTHAHRDDPASSARAMMRRLLEGYARLGCATDLLAIREAALEGANYPQRRCSDLRAKGLIEPATDAAGARLYAKNPNGNLAMVCRITDAGLAHLAT